MSKDPRLPKKLEKAQIKKMKYEKPTSPTDKLPYSLIPNRKMRRALPKLK